MIGIRQIMKVVFLKSNFIQFKKKNCIYAHFCPLLQWTLITTLTFSLIYSNFKIVPTTCYISDIISVTVCFLILQSVMPSRIVFGTKIGSEASSTPSICFEVKSRWVEGLGNLINHINPNAHFLLLSSVFCERELLLFSKTIAKNATDIIKVFQWNGLSRIISFWDIRLEIFYQKSNDFKQTF